MNRQEAKLVLAGYRPNGADATDHRLAEALEFARRDPELSAWFKSQQRFDSAVAAKLRTVVPPPGLRSEILISLRLQGRRANRHWLPAAVALVVLGIAAGLFRWRVSSAVGTDESHLVMFATNYAANGIALQKQSDDSATLRNWLVAEHAPLPNEWPRELAMLHSLGCRTLNFKGRTITLICFGQEREFHLFVARRTDFPQMNMAAKARLHADAGGWCAADWADKDHFFVLVSDALPDDLQRYLPAKAQPARTGA